MISDQAEGKKRMKAIGKVDVPQEAFMAVLRLEKEVLWYCACLLPIQRLFILGDVHRHFKFEVVLLLALSQPARLLLPLHFHVDSAMQETEVTRDPA